MFIQDHMLILVTWVDEMQRKYIEPSSYFLGHNTFRNKKLCQQFRALSSS